MIRSERNIHNGDNGEIDFASFLRPNPFDFQRAGKPLPSSGTLVAGQFRRAFKYQGMTIAEGLVTTYPYASLHRYFFPLPYADYGEVAFGNFDRNKQLEIEYVKSLDVRKSDRYKYQNSNPKSDGYRTDGWVNEEKVSVPSEGNVAVRRGPNVVIPEYSRSFSDNERNAFGRTDLLSFFELGDTEGIINFIKGVFGTAMDLPKEDVAIILEKAKARLLAK